MKLNLEKIHLFGFDIMFDDEWNAYLIEVNASPSMDYSTKITSKLVPEMIDNLMEIVIDRKMNDKKVGKWIKVWNGKGKIDKNNIPNKSNLY